MTKNGRETSLLKKDQSAGQVAIDEEDHLDQTLNNNRRSNVDTRLDVVLGKSSPQSGGLEDLTSASPLGHNILR